MHFNLSAVSPVFNLRLACHCEIICPQLYRFSSHAFVASFNSTERLCHVVALVLVYKSQPPNFPGRH
jgi:hypothetical protein